MAAYRVEISDFSADAHSVEAYEIRDAHELADLIAREDAADPSYVLANPEPASYPTLVVFDRDSAQPSPDEDVHALLLGNIFYWYEVGEVAVAPHMRLN